MNSEVIQPALLSIETLPSSQAPNKQEPDENSVASEWGDLVAQITKVSKHVSNYEIYVSYEIECVANRPDYPTGKSTVVRRYREFDWLHKRFQQIYSVLFVPPLPGKKLLTQFKSSSAGFVDRRSNGLWYFLRKTTAHPILSSSSDLRAFLTLSRQDLHDYMQSHVVEIALLSFVLPNRSDELPLPEPDQSPSASATAGGLRRAFVTSPTSMLSRSSDSAARSLLRASGKFAVYYDEVASYLVMCQKMASVMDKVAIQLSTLALDYGEMTKLMDEWPLDHRPFRDQSNSSATSGPATAPALGPSMARGALRKLASATQALADQLSQGSGNTWLNEANFAEVAKNVLKYRDHIQTNYVNAEAEVKRRIDTEELEQQQPDLQKKSKFTIPWKKKSTDALIVKANRLQDELAFSNNHVESEFLRWRLARNEETNACLTGMACAYLDYWSTVSEAWRAFLGDIDTVQHRRTSQSLIYSNPSITTNDSSLSIFSEEDN